MIFEHDGYNVKIIDISKIYNFSISYTENTSKISLREMRERLKARITETFDRRGMCHYQLVGIYTVDHGIIKEERYVYTPNNNIIIEDK